MVGPSTYGQQGHARRGTARYKSSSQARFLDNRSHVSHAHDARLLGPQVCPLPPHADGNLPDAAGAVREAA